MTEAARSCTVVRFRPASQTVLLAEMEVCRADAVDYRSMGDQLRLNGRGKDAARAYAKCRRSANRYQMLRRLLGL